MTANERKREKRDKGFILVVVIWFAGLLALIAATYAHTIRTHVRVSSNVSESVRAQMLADAGTMLAVLDLLSSAKAPGRQRRFAVDGQVVGCSITGEGRVTVIVQDEAARVDINKAGLPLLESLLIGLGEPPDVASSVAAAILDFRDRDDERHLGGAERADYVDAGLNWPPKNAPFEAVDELGQVMGMTHELALKLTPHITIHSGNAGIDARVADDELIAVLRRGMIGANASFAIFPQTSRDNSLPEMFTANSRQRTFGIRVLAITNSGARFVRDAVVDLGPARLPNYSFLVWQRGATSTVGATGETEHRFDVSATQLPPC